MSISVPGRPTVSGQPPLQYRDVFVLTTYLSRVSATGGVVRGLRQGGVPVTVLKKGDVGGAAAVAAMSGPDEVLVARGEDVCGLERKVVVWLEESERPRGGVGQGDDEQYGRLEAVSRCTAQLVCVLDESGH